MRAKKPPHLIAIHMINCGGFHTRSLPLAETLLLVHLFVKIIVITTNVGWLAGFGTARLPTVGAVRGTQRYLAAQQNDEEQLAEAAIESVSQYGRYGDRRISVLCRKRAGGWAGARRSESGAGRC
jgi:hypothetical protein